MSKKLILCLALLIMGVWVLGCMPPPFYGTAKIEPGFHWDAGVAGGGGIVCDFMGGEEMEGLGGGVSTELRYGSNKYVQWHARAGVDTYIGGAPVVPRIGMGIQTALPLEVVTPAFRLEAAGIWPVTITPALLLGIGRNEIPTLGFRLHYWLGEYIYLSAGELFLTIHLMPRWGVFVSGAKGDDLQWITLGVGYKIR
jgi:hypothetical protein